MFRVILLTTPLLIGAANGRGRTHLMLCNVWVVNHRCSLRNGTYFIVILMVFHQPSSSGQLGAIHFESRGMATCFGHMAMFRNSFFFKSP